MPRWKPKTPREKFLGELKKLETKIAAKRTELAELEAFRSQLETIVGATAQTEGKAQH